jgi:hypothetical protein
MEKELKLYMLMLGCKPEGRLTEQHDIFFGISSSLKELTPQMNAFWPEAKERIHIDAWREVSVVDHFSIKITDRDTEATVTSEKLFFINLGGYKKNEFEEYHYKILTVAQSFELASKKAEATTFYKHCGFDEAISHIDDKYGIDVDDIYTIEDVLDTHLKEKYSIKITQSKTELEEDILHIGYLKIDGLG